MKRVRLLTPLLVFLITGCSDGTGSTAVPAAEGPNTIERSSGDQQVGHAGLPLPRPMTVRVLTSAGRPVADAPVNFLVSSGGGWLSERQPVLTDRNGEATVVWYMGPEPAGTHVLMASSAAGAVAFRANVVEHEPDRYAGPAAHIELRVGTLPLILSAGRGGNLMPGNIPDRGAAGDAHAGTLELLEEILRVFEERGRGTPTVLLSRLHRSRLDPDEELPAAAAAGTAAEVAWREYHSFLAGARGHLARRYGTGLFIDIHGRPDAGDLVEFGYLLSAAELALEDPALDQPVYAQRSSLRAVASGSYTSLSEVLRGPRSLGTLLQNRTAAATPSASVRTPGPGYVAGGLSTRLYGSQDGLPVSAVHLQVPFAGYRDSPENRRRFAAKFVDALDEFFGAHLGAGLNADQWR